ncbi:recombinase family protein [Siminovitchia fordii]|uniref:Resolvase homolog YokA n=1 Tax=Siminovitchia fordii TaxID=254759 RepID=A0ABQ4KE39_9BACI|nr:recombinase family protein [Siminovitchia fordii]GIN23143.1 resolvase homolog YokA [Siminovitchia fordii]
MHKVDYDIKNIINYVRKSRRDEEREKRTGEDTLTEQKKLMQKVLDDLGIPYKQEFEVGSGDQISTRPVFSRILEELKAGKYDAIAVKEISRLGRGSMSDMGIIYDIITGRVTGKSIYIITPYRIYDPRNSADQRQIRFEMFFAREEFETIRERLTGARYSAAMEGKWMGTVPFGYTRDEKTMRLKPLEEEAKVVRLIYDLYLNGIDGRDVRERAIATYLKRVGIKTAKGKTNWDTTQLRRILTNPVYIGTASFRTTEKTLNGKKIKRPKDEHIIVHNAHPEIISEEDFYDVQRKMRIKKVPKVKFDVNIYPLSGLVDCNECGNRLMVNRYKRTRRSGSSYIDKYLRCKGGCTIIKYEVVDTALEELLESLSVINGDKLRELINTSANKMNNEERQLMAEEVKKSMEKRKSDLEKRLKFIQEKHFLGVYSDEEYLLFKEEIDKEINELNEMETKTKEEVSVANDDTDIKKIQDALNDLSELYKKSNDDSIKNQILKHIFNEITLNILEKGTKRQGAKISLDISLSMNLINNPDGKIEVKG